jgi:hypothetical protein
MNVKGLVHSYGYGPTRPKETTTIKTNFMDHHETNPFDCWAALFELRKVNSFTSSSCSVKLTEKC